MNKLSDTDLCPFGKYWKTPMQDVPVSYLHYMWTVNGFSAIKPLDVLPEREHQRHAYLVAMYIRDNLNALKMEDTDRIW